METPAQAWARCKPYLEAAVRRFGEGCIEDAQREIEAGRAWFVPGAESAAVVQITKDANLWLAGGSLPEMLKRLPETEAWARSMGCERVTLIGRPGWDRVLAPHGYRPLSVLAKDLT